MVAVDFTPALVVVPLPPLKQPQGQGSCTTSKDTRASSSRSSVRATSTTAPYSSGSSTEQ